MRGKIRTQSRVLARMKPDVSIALSNVEKEIFRILSWTCYAILDLLAHPHILKILLCRENFLLLISLLFRNLIECNLHRGLIIQRGVTLTPSG